eukprot:CAMPEP_0168733066 /NCGR_PEP_ID=MMETSP0724-20121128/8094_1 /TAXON_ID=265536 /ORGANISM="Amphiprora sp., Strain CCMP467" /LENGTH=416 /DNA_ID=CAMNT_0008780103 /DNA_START=94 /DNA_END=1344 /DNA_ORIENTATION=+
MISYVKYSCAFLLGVLGAWVLLVPNTTTTTLTLITDGMMLDRISSGTTTTSSQKRTTTNAKRIMRMKPLFPPPFTIGLGTMDLTAQDAPRVIRQALLHIGYRRIDCAPVYGNEAAIGDALQDVLGGSSSSSSSSNDDNDNESNNNNNLPRLHRSDLYVVSKLPSALHHNPSRALAKTLRDLRLEYLDLYLIHWPVAFEPYDLTDREFLQRGYDDGAEPLDDSGNGQKIDLQRSIHDTWRAMEALLETGQVKQIGVSNFPVSLLHELLTRATVPPVVNQCEGHPFLPQDHLVTYCQRRGVHFQAYSPLGTPGYKESSEPSLLQHPVVQSIAQRHSGNHGTTTTTTTITAAQVLIAWALQRNTSVVVKSSSDEHLRDNWRALELQLTHDDLEQLQTLPPWRFFRPQEWWGDMPVAVFD